MSEYNKLCERHKELRERIKKDTSELLALDTKLKEIEKYSGRWHRPIGNYNSVFFTEKGFMSWLKSKL